MDKKLSKVINKELTDAYVGESNVTLSQAMACICATLYDPYQKLDNQKGTYEEVNSLNYQQMLLLSSMANTIWCQINDPTQNAKGYFKGARHEVDKARKSLERLNASNDGTEISLVAIDKADDYLSRQESKHALLDEMYHMFANFMEVATGYTHNPYEPWLHKPQAANAEPDTELEARVKAKLEARKMKLQTEGYTPANDGVDAVGRETA